MISSITTTEPEWDEEERAWVLALLDYEADQCRGCGGQLSETTDPDTEGKWKVQLPVRCHKCTALAEHQQAYAETKHNHALLWAAERV